MQEVKTQFNIVASRNRKKKKLWQYSRQKIKSIAELRHRQKVRKECLFTILRVGLTGLNELSEVGTSGL